MDAPPGPGAEAEDQPRTLERVAHILLRVVMEIVAAKAIDDGADDGTNFP